MSELAEAEAVLAPLESYAYRCHGASIELVRAFGRGRVARGSCRGVLGQHSWVMLGDDCYDVDTTIIDPTLWSYDATVTGIWTGSYRDGRHRPHGAGSIWNWGRPAPAQGPVVRLTPRQPFSDAAKDFLRLLGPLNQLGWIHLAHAPVGGWPAAEIIDAIANTKSLAALVPVDIVGMLTDRNPGDLYLPRPCDREE